MAIEKLSDVHKVRMYVREGISVDSQTLHYKGLEDFGGENEPTQDLNAKANRGLVIMYQAFNKEHTAQPISVFTSKGPVVGNMLAKLILKAIICLEKCNVKIHAFVTDGASTNRGYWTFFSTSTG